tara:strand:+ start:183 stop:986 length:804 start_codon:yes stop_codon:yes gene_type:complete
MSTVIVSPSKYEELTNALNTDSVDVTYSDIKSFGDKGFRSMNVLWKGKVIQFQARNLNTPFGVEEFENDNNTRVQRSVQFDLPDVDEANEHDKKVRDVYKFKQLYTALEDKLKRDAEKNQQLWLNQKGKKEFTKEVIDDKFSAIVKEHPDGKYHDKFKVKLTYFQKKDEDGDNEYPNFEIYDMEKQEIEDYSDLKEVISRRTKCNVLIHMNVWFTGKGFGVTQKVKQLQIVEKEENEKPSVFDNSDEEDDDDNVVEDSDDDAAEDSD